MRFIDFIQDRARYYNCPVCGRSLKGCELRMLKHIDNRFTVQVTCAACHVQFIVILAVQGEGLESLAEDELEVQLGEAEAAGDVLGELHRQPPRHHPPRDPIQPDEVLDVHLLLKGFNGRLPDLLRQPSGDRK